MLLRNIGVFLFSAVLGASSATLAGVRLASYCYMNAQTGAVVGQALDQKMPIASTSKVVTSLLALNRYKLNGQFYTYFTVNPVGDGSYDMHISGSLDPYFDSSRMHVVISQLNKVGVFKIRNLSFDEKFKYIHETDAHRFFGGGELIQPLVLKDELNFPEPYLVAAQLKEMNKILSTYNQTAAVLEKSGLKLFKNPKLTIEKISYLQSSQYHRPSTANTFFVPSQSLKSIIKSINWNSNNYAANQLFLASGGFGFFNHLFRGVYNLSNNDISFVNGSGMNQDLSGNGRLYNQASCRTMVKVMAALDIEVQKQGGQLQDIMSVVGMDIGSTVGGAVYSSALTRSAVIAKTGTIGTNITLVGKAYTKKGKYYFMYNTEIGSPSQDGPARALISSQLRQAIMAWGGPAPFAYKSDNPVVDGNMSDYVKEAYLRRNASNKIGTN